MSFLAVTQCLRGVPLCCFAVKVLVYSRIISLVNKFYFFFAIKWRGLRVRIYTTEYDTAFTTAKSTTILFSFHV